MDEIKEISEKERERRRKISEYRKKAIAEKRKKGLEAYHRRRRAAKRKREREEALKKEKERQKKEKERQKKLAASKKRKPGRPRKPGPKKKRRPKKVPKFNPRNSKPPYIYKIISCRNGRQNSFIGRYRTIEEAYEAFGKLKASDNAIIFPSMVTVDETKLRNSIDEYILIERGGDGNAIMRNEYGKLVEQRLSVEGWTMIDKYQYRKEETFYVWGYNPKNDRKTFLWIYNEMLTADIVAPYELRRVILYRNKVIVKHDDGYLDIIVCKSESDSVRLYNKLEEWVKKDKVKQIYFIGDYSQKPERTRLEDDIAAQTGWEKRKIQMRYTTYYRK